MCDENRGGPWSRIVVVRLEDASAHRTCNIKDRQNICSGNILNGIFMFSTVLRAEYVDQMRS